MLIASEYSDSVHSLGRLQNGAAGLGPVVCQGTNVTIRKMSNIRLGTCRTCSCECTLQSTQLSVLAHRHPAKGESKIQPGTEGVYREAHFKQKKLKRGYSHLWMETSCFAPVGTDGTNNCSKPPTNRCSISSIRSISGSEKLQLRRLMEPGGLTMPGAETQLNGTAALSAS